MHSRRAFGLLALATTVVLANPSYAEAIHAFQAASDDRAVIFTGQIERIDYRPDRTLVVVTVRVTRRLIGEIDNFAVMSFPAGSDSPSDRPDERPLFDEFGHLVVGDEVVVAAWYRSDGALSIADLKKTDTPEGEALVAAAEQT